MKNFIIKILNPDSVEVNSAASNTRQSVYIDNSKEFRIEQVIVNVCFCFQKHSGDVY